ncbi:hypothetical protein Lal_00030885, partial [Lupinus albus]
MGSVIASSWWKDLGKVGSSVEVTRGWFDDNIWKEIGDGLQTLFWLEIKVSNWFSLDYFVLLQIINLGEESLAQNLYDLIHNHSCKRSSLDRWRWSLDASGDYVVKIVYLAQLIHQQSLIGKELTNCWINCVPLTICCFVWKLIRGRLPTRDELFKRNVIIRVDDMLCIFCNNHVETISVINPSLVLDSLKLHDFIRRALNHKGTPFRIQQHSWCVRPIRDPNCHRLLIRKYIPCFNYEIECFFGKRKARFIRVEEEGKAVILALHGVDVIGTMINAEYGIPIMV